MVVIAIPQEMMTQLVPVETVVDARSLERHPLSAVFGDMDAETYAEFVENFRHNPIPELCEIILYEGKVFDGWHRTQAAIQTGQERLLRFVAYRGNQPSLLAAILNGHRRQLPSKERAIAMVECLEWDEGKGDDASENAAGFSTFVRAAEAASVSVRQLERARAAKRAGLLDYVKQGVMELEDAYAITRRNNLLAAVHDQTVPVEDAVTQVRTARRLARRERAQRQLDRSEEPAGEEERNADEVGHVTETETADDRDREIARLNARIDRLLESRDQAVSQRETLSERYIALRDQRDALMEALKGPGVAFIIDAGSYRPSGDLLVAEQGTVLRVLGPTGSQHNVRLAAVPLPDLPDLPQQPTRVSDSAWVDFQTESVLALSMNPVDYPTLADIGNHRPAGFDDWERGDKHRWTRRYNQLLKRSDELRQRLDPGAN